jgi:hypothetical protein
MHTWSAEHSVEITEWHTHSTSSILSAVLSNLKTLQNIRKSKYQREGINEVENYR